MRPMLRAILRMVDRAWVGLGGKRPRYRSVRVVSWAARLRASQPIPCCAVGYRG